MTCTETNGVFECNDLTDVWAMVFNPVEGRTYTGLETPTMQDLERIEPGDDVMISRDINKITVTVVENEICNQRICGIVSLGDIEDQPFNIGDTICFQWKNVYSITPPITISPDEGCICP